MFLHRHGPYLERSNYSGPCFSFDFSSRSLLHAGLNPCWWFDDWERWYHRNLWSVKSLSFCDFAWYRQLRLQLILKNRGRVSLWLTLLFVTTIQYKYAWMLMLSPDPKKYHWLFIGKTLWYILEVLENFLWQTLPVISIVHSDSLNFWSLI